MGRQVGEGVRAIMPGFFFERAKGLAYASQMQDGTMTVQVNTQLFADLQNGYDLRPGLRRLDRPVLIVQGYQDPLGDKTAEQIHEAIQASTLVHIRQCGHFPWLEQPEEFRRIMTGFFESKRGTPQPRSLAAPRYHLYVRAGCSVSQICCCSAMLSATKPANVSWSCRKDASLPRHHRMQ